MVAVRSGQLNLRAVGPQRGREPRQEHALTVDHSSVCGQIALVNSSADKQGERANANGRDEVGHYDGLEMGQLLEARK